MNLAPILPRPIVSLPAPLRSKIERAAVVAYPLEACGLLIGRRTADRIEVADVADSNNVAEGCRRHRFEVDPALRLAVQRRLRGSDAAIIGHYHSHPDHPPEPSAHDWAMAFEPDLLWLIVGISGGHPQTVRAFVVDQNRHGFAEAKVQQPD